jgi:ribosomal protein S18 acetylase RimI-like enzyme
MHEKLTHRKATIHDLNAIVALLRDDHLGYNREQQTGILDQRYRHAFARIDLDPNHYLMVVEMDTTMVATCHLTLMPSLTLIGSIRMQIEAVRVASDYRGQKIGEWMITAAIDYGKARGAAIIQLATDKQRLRAQQFYQRLGFTASHEGMKLYLQTDL